MVFRELTRILLFNFYEFENDERIIETSFKIIITNFYSQLSDTDKSIKNKMSTLYKLLPLYMLLPSSECNSNVIMFRYTSRSTAVQSILAK